MKKSFVQTSMIVGSLILLFSCNTIFERKIDQQNVAAKEKQVEATKQAEASNENISDIPLGFRFGMTRNEVSRLGRELISKNIITSNNIYDYSYIYTTNNNEKIKFGLDFRYFGDALEILYFHLGYQIDLDQKQYENEIFSILSADLSNKLDSTYNKISYYETYDSKTSKFPIIKWFKKNQIITLKNYVGVFLSYEDARIAKKASEKYVQDIRNSARKRIGNVVVTNSSYDGSVSQVVDYLKKNLKDPKSYEGIEWSKVKETPDGYIVSHKYRAKNSFGGYVIENQTFYLNFNGEVINGLN